MQALKIAAAKGRHYAGTRPDRARATVHRLPRGPGAARRRGWWLVTLLAAAGPVLGADLPRVGATLEGLTVSGISSGGYMAVQYQVAHASTVRGAGVLAAGPYNCARDSAMRALTTCMSPTAWAPPPDVAGAPTELDALARSGRIDPPTGLADNKAWVLSGGRDHTVKRPVVTALVDFYRHWIKDTDAVRLVTVEEAGHAMISVADENANACDVTAPPYINRCGTLDAAGELLKHLLGPLQDRAEQPAGTLMAFDQRPFVDGTPVDASLADEGYAFIPDACRGGGCRVHVVFHGCQQSAGQIGKRFVQEAGYNEWAAGNRLIVLYPQTVSRYGWALGSWRWVFNPKGCWDWWGYTGSDYATRQAPQIAAVRRMTQRLASPP